MVSTVDIHGASTPRDPLQCSTVQHHSGKQKKKRGRSKQRARYLGGKEERVGQFRSCLVTDHDSR
jgi:hypothetical protein